MEAVVQSLAAALANQSPCVSDSPVCSLLALIRVHSMTLGNVYDLDLKKNESLIREVIIQAQGEVQRAMALLPTLY